MHRGALATVTIVVVALTPVSAWAHGDATALDRPVEFSGRIVPADEVTPESWEIVDDVATYRGGIRRGEVETMSDPRLDGEVTLTTNRDLHLGAFGLELARSTIRIETDDGAWQEVPSLVVDFGDGRPSTRTSALVGEGAYAGWITVAQVTLDPGTRALALEGVILKGALPPEPAKASPE